jgi:hypothetical protein
MPPRAYRSAPGPGAVWYTYQQMPGRRTIGVIVVVALLAIPALALAASPRPPKSGHWKITGEGVGSGGTFKISGKYVSGVRMPGENCNLPEVSVPGRQKLRLISQGGYSNWVIGTNDPSRKSPYDIGGVVGLRVKVDAAGGKVYSGRLEFIFGILDHASENSGDLYVGSCVIPFDAER